VENKKRAAPEGKLRNSSPLNRAGYLIWQRRMEHDPPDHPTFTLLLKSEIGFLFAPKCVCCLTHLRDAKRLREKN
jgi:hypothetical protein